MQLLTADRCDHCQRDFSRDPVASPVICPSCGVENVRAVIEKKPRMKETATARPAAERAVNPAAQAKPPRPSKTKLKAKS